MRAALTAPGADFEVTTTNVRGVDIKTYANALTNLRDAWVSTAAYAEREYIVYEDERLTYAQAHEHVNSLGNWLIGQVCGPAIESLLPCATTPSGYSATGLYYLLAQPSLA